MLAWLIIQSIVLAILVIAFLCHRSHVNAAIEAGTESFDRLDAAVFSTKTIDRASFLGTTFPCTVQDYDRTVVQTVRKDLDALLVALNMEIGEVPAKPAVPAKLVAKKKRRNKKT